MLPRLCIITRTQYGYHIDAFYMVKYLSNNYIIDYLCFDHGKKKIDIKSPNLKVYYMKKHENTIYRNIYFIDRIIKLIRVKDYKLVFIKYFMGSCFVKLLSSNVSIILDIRSLAVNKNILYSLIYNKLIYIESYFFRNITIISDSIREKLKIDISKSYILPVGAQQFSDSAINFTKLNLLYVGTFKLRNLDETLLGLKYFVDKHKNDIDISYTIIGDGPELGQLIQLSCNLKIDKLVKFAGYIPNNELYKYFNNVNVGVSYIPINKYFNFQPPTKTYEYLLSGLPTIATKTQGNLECINESNGVLICDNPSDFCRGLEQVYYSKDFYKSATIRKEIKDKNWLYIYREFNKYLYKNFLRK